MTHKFKNEGTFAEQLEKLLGNPKKRSPALNAVSPDSPITSTVTDAPAPLNPTPNMKEQTK
jgi:hypothetical protein